MTNYTRKFHLHPRTYDFVDFPNTKHHRPLAYEPKTPHIHSVYLVHKDTRDRFEMLMSKEFSQIVFHPSMRSVIQAYAVPIRDTAEDLERVVSYSSKTARLKRFADADIDLFNMFPIPQSALATRKSRKEKIHCDDLEISKSARAQSMFAKQRNKLYERFSDAPSEYPIFSCSQTTQNSSRTSSRAPSALETNR
tara:strand:+ start:26 stop:607 length:582 start_codon:yes stop_codon:yes gene_type:complete